MKVVILAGGLGTRLSEETHIKPKPMVEIGGMPILWHIMKIYPQYGFNDFIDADDCILEQSPFITLAKNNDLKAFKHDDFWHPMDTLRDKNYLDDLWEKSSAPWKLWQE